MYVCMYVCMYACMYVCMYVCMYACMYVCMYVCMHACMYVCMYVCMHACTVSVCEVLRQISTSRGIKDTHANLTEPQNIIRRSRQRIFHWVRCRCPFWMMIAPVESPHAQLSNGGTTEPCSRTCGVHILVSGSTIRTK